MGKQILLESNSTILRNAFALNSTLCTIYYRTRVFIVFVEIYNFFSENNNSENDGNNYFTLKIARHLIVFLSVNEKCITQRIPRCNYKSLADNYLHESFCFYNSKGTRNLLFDLITAAFTPHERTRNITR